MTAPDPAPMVPASEILALAEEWECSDPNGEYGYSATVHREACMWCRGADELRALVAANESRPTKRPCRESEHLWCDVEGRCLNCDAMKVAAAPVGEPLGDHPRTDPGDGRSECPSCGKFVWLVTHSCKGVPVTQAAINRMNAPRVPVGDPAPPPLSREPDRLGEEGEAAWEEFDEDNILDSDGFAHTAFLAGFRAARLAGKDGEE